MSMDKLIEINAIKEAQELWDMDAEESNRWDSLDQEERGYLIEERVRIFKALKMESYLEEAFNLIDAAVFVGDTFHSPENVVILYDYIKRWTGEVEKPVGYDQYIAERERSTKARRASSMRVLIMGEDNE